MVLMHRIYKVNSRSFHEKKASGLYYKPMMIVNDDYRVVNKLEASLTDDARVIIYDHHMFIVQATGCGMRKIIFKTL
jgi:hypothetical protein